MNDQSTLGTREQQVLEYFRNHAGRVLDRTELSERIWGFRLDPRSRTIDQTIAQLRKKLPPDQQIITHRTCGYQYVNGGRRPRT